MTAEGAIKTGRLLTFRAGPGRYALFLEEVLGVQNPSENGAVPDRGVLFQGRPVAALDVRLLWWGGSASPGTAAAAVIIVGSCGRATALMVDRVEGIVEGAEMRPLPALVAPFVRGVFRGVTQHADGDRLVVDTTALARAAAVGGQGGPGTA